jgi:small subunit ribosomal protein S15
VINKQEVIKVYRISPKDNGSPEVQIGILSEQINNVSNHLRIHIRDNSSRRGLLGMVGRRRRLLHKLEANEPERFEALIRKVDERGGF